MPTRTNTDFINLVPLSNGRDYHQTTLTSGKKILLIPNHQETYPNTVETCAGHGADVVLPIDQQENDEITNFIHRLDETGHFTDRAAIVWMRAFWTGSVWIDTKTNEPLQYENDIHSYMVSIPYSIMGNVL